MRFVGIDPDLHTLSVAVLDGDELTVHMVKHNGLKDEEAVVAILRELKHCYYLSHGIYDMSYVLAVESQNVTYTGKKNAAKPQDQIHLAQVAGGVAAHFADARRTYLVKPQAWKGSVPKKIHQRRTLRKLGIEFEMMGGASPYPVPLNYERFVASGKANKGDWKDINDSVGLAIYARDRYNREGGR